MMDTRQQARQFPWIRLYTEMVDDPKIEALPLNHRYLWVVTLAMAGRSPVRGTLVVDSVRRNPLPLVSLAQRACMTEQEVVEGLQTFANLGMMRRDDDGVWVVSNWSQRQFTSDSSAERVRSHRQKKAEARHQAIPCVYRGVELRSKLERSWALWLDESGIQWSYEVEGYHLTDESGVEYWYLPDFFLPDRRAFLEIKGILRNKDRRKIEALAQVAAVRGIVTLVGTTTVGEIEVVQPTPAGFCDFESWSNPANGPLVPAHRSSHLATDGRSDDGGE